MASSSGLTRWDAMLKRACSTRGPAAVGRDDASRHVPGAITEEEGDEFRHLLGLAGPAPQHSPTDPLPLSLGQLGLGRTGGEQRCIDGARAHTVDADALGSVV